MNDFLKMIVSLSASGSLLIIFLLLSRPFIQNMLSKQWQYYLWLIVIARLVLPVSVQVNVMGHAFRQAEQAAVFLLSGADSAAASDASDGSSLKDYNAEPAEADDPAAGNKSVPAETDDPAADDTAGYKTGAAAKTELFAADVLKAAVSHLWLAWLCIALALLVRKITVYQSFVNYIKAGWKEVSDIELLDRLALEEQRCGIRRPAGLYTNALISSPLLLGFFRPCIVLPDVCLPDMEFLFTLRHELMHYKRRDMFYKWLIQAVMCIHWFNPLVWLMGRELGRACELACDEAVIRTLDAQQRRLYGDTLIHAVKTGGCNSNYHSRISAMLSESMQLLKERLTAIMNFKKSTKRAVVRSAVFTAVLMMGAVSAGAYTGPESRKTAFGQPSGQASAAADTKTADWAERFYESGIIQLFQSAFSQMKESEQKKWLNKIYADHEIAFFGAAVSELEEDSPLTAFFAKKAYADDEIAIFSILASHMNDAQLESWLEQALEDKKAAFAAVLYNALGRDDEKEKMEAKLEKQRLAEYKKYGITKKGAKYYYKGTQIRILLDVQPGSSAYILNMDPKGTAKIKITRGSDGSIKSVGGLTAEEEKRLFVGMDNEEPDQTKDDRKNIVIPVDIARIRNGEYVWLGTYDLKKGDKVYYNVSAKTGNRLDVGFAKPGQKNPGTTYRTISNRRTDGKLEVKSGAMVWKSPLKSGKYSLFIHTKGGNLTGVKGQIKIVKAV